MAYCSQGSTCLLPPGGSPLFALPQKPPLLQSSSAAPSEKSSIAKLSSSRNLLEPTVDKNGYLCSPRAARELAFSILYAALLLGEKPMLVFKNRLKQRSGYLAKGLIAGYKHAPDVGGSIVVKDALSAKKLEAEQLEESLLEAAVLSAPPNKVYKRSILMMAQEIIKVTADSWAEHDVILSDLLPTSWKAVELGQRFTDMRSARVIHGCLGKFTESAFYKDSQVN